jgi:uncharacterized membrane protein YcaP (DUF421 family)
MDWSNLFVLQNPFLETILRGSVMYLMLFILLRLVLKRESGALALTDLLVVVLIADAAQNAMIGDSTSLADGLLLVATIILWSYTLDRLGYRYPAIGRVIHPPPLELVKDGQVIHRNLRKEFITLDELESKLRQQGVEDVSQVKKAYIEGNGKFSVITKELEPKKQNAEDEEVF